MQRASQRQGRSDHVGKRFDGGGDEGEEAGERRDQGKVQPGLGSYSVQSVTVSKYLLGAEQGEREKMAGKAGRTAPPVLGAD